MNKILKTKNFNKKNYKIENRKRFPFENVLIPIVAITVSDKYIKYT